jgi:hypothetical protein
VLHFPPSSRTPMSVIDRSVRLLSKLKKVHHRTSRAPYHHHTVPPHLSRLTIAPTKSPISPHTTPPKWSSSKKSWTRSSSANRRAPMTKTNGTQTPVRHLSTKLNPRSHIPSNAEPDRKTSMTLTQHRVRPRIRILLHPRRNAVRAHQRTERHRARIDAPQHQRKVRDAVELDQERAFVWRQDAVGRVDERVAAGRAVGAGVQRGADDCRAGARGDDGAEGAE